MLGIDAIIIKEHRGGGASGHCVTVHRHMTLSIIVVAENPVRAAILDEGLRQGGYTPVTVLSDTANLVKKIHAIDPNVIVVDLENPSREALEQMFQVSKAVRRPVAMFVDRSDRATTESAISAGVSAYVVDGLKKERIPSVVELAVSRFDALARLQGELDSAKEALEERKAVERAKGILMKQHGLSEQEAYTRLRKSAMSQKKRLADVAQSVVTAARVLDEG